MDDDEDVTLEGEPLDQYLQNIGYVDFLSVNRQPHCEHDLKPKRHVFSRLKDVFVQSIGIPSFMNPLWQNENVLDSESYQEIINIILQSKILFSEDYQLISNLKLEKITDRKAWWHNSFLLPLILLISLRNLKLKNTLLFSITLFFGGWTSGKYYLRKRYLNKIQELVNTLQKFSFTVKKSLKYLQESEIISRGFTYAVTGSTAELLENSALQIIERKWHISPGFRQTIAVALDSMIKIISKSTRDLLLFSPLRSQFDNVQHYLSCHEELLSKLSIISTGCDDHVCENPTEIKLNVLKSLHHHHLLLVSEFLRRFSMSFCPLLQNRNKNFHLMKTMFITEIITCCSNLQKNLDMEFNYLCNYGISTGLMKNTNKIKYPVTKYGDIYVKVHSAIFHLQSMLRTTHCVEECLRNYEKIDVADETLEELHVTFKHILKELELCKSCFEEGQKNIESLKYPDNLIINKKKELNEGSFVPHENVKIVHVGKTDLDPVVPDEVFEALCTQETFLTDDSDDFLQLNKAEIERREIQKTCAKVMLEELKYVLVDKAKEWKEREEKALELKRVKEKVNKRETPNQYEVCKNNDDIENVEVNNDNGLNNVVAVEDKIFNISKEISKETSSCNELENTINNYSSSTRKNVIKSTNTEDYGEDNLTNKSSKTADFISSGIESSNENPNRVDSGHSSSKCEENSNEAESNIPIGLGLPAFALPQHRFMLKDNEFETFYGYGENSDSEDSDDNAQ